MRHEMNWFLFPVLCCLSMLLSGCYESKNPLSDPNVNETDPSLVGVWTVSTGGNKGVYTISMPSSDENLPKGVMKCQTQRGGKTTYVLLIPTKIGDDRFLSVPQRDDYTATITSWKSDAVVSYSLFKYKVAGNKIKFYQRNEATTNQRMFSAIKNGDLRGTTKDIPRSGFMTEPTESLRNYVEDNEAWLFTEKTEATKEKAEATK